MSKTLCPALLALATVSITQAAEIDITVELPRVDVAEYHFPYVAIWLEDSQMQSTQIAVWYDLEMANDGGEEWLKDIRQWWRRGGRSLDLPIDGITSATRGPGSHHLSIGSAQLEDLPAGEYKIRIEASREVGGRELVDVPFQLPIHEASTAQVSGNTELRTIEVRFAP